MQSMRQNTKRSLARLIAAFLVAILTALVGNRHLNQKKDYGPAPEQVSGPARLIDGDSLFVGGSEVRLKGIDAPEGRQTCTRQGRSWDCGNAARDELQALIGGNQVNCKVSERDMHGRLLSYCSAGGRDLNGAMVGAGFAIAFGGYASEEGQAKAARRGLWAGEFQRPREWRDQHGAGH